MAKREELLERRLAQASPFKRQAFLALEDVRAALEGRDDVFDITRDGVSLSPGLFHACFSVWRREPLEDNPHAGALLTACWGGVRFFTYAAPGTEARDG